MRHLRWPCTWLRKVEQALACVSELAEALSAVVRQQRVCGMHWHWVCGRVRGAGTVCEALDCAYDHSLLPPRQSPPKAEFEQLCHGLSEARGEVSFRDAACLSWRLSRWLDG